MAYTKHKNIPPRHASEHHRELNDALIMIRTALRSLPDDGLRHLALCTAHAELALSMNLDPFIAAAGVVNAHGTIRGFKDAPK